MVKKINILLVLLLVIVSIGAVSAADDLNDTVQASDEAIVETMEVSEDADLLSDDTHDDVTSTSHSITPTNYKEYFDNKGELNSSKVNAGDEIRIEDDFRNTDFTFKTSVNVIGKDGVKLENCSFTFEGASSGSTVSNLNINNTKGYAYGIFLDGVSNCVIQNCYIKNTGVSSYAICVANNANYNNVTNNKLITYGLTYGHGTRSTPPVLVSGAHYNYLANNNIECDDANGIYLSNYGGGPLIGGNSNFNVIYNNTIKYNVLPTSWAYGIQCMGSNNTVKSNRIIGAYLAISAGSNAIVRDNNIINVTGADFNKIGVEVGGQSAIVSGSNSVIINNTIVNAKIGPNDEAIRVSDNCLIEGNNIEVKLSGKGIVPLGSNITIKNNRILTSGGSGIFYNTRGFNLEIIGNTITTGSGIGILIQKVSRKSMPGNITIIYNIVNCTGKYAIDAKEANASMEWEYHDNTIVNKNKVETPMGEFDPTKPVYRFNGTTRHITPENYGEFINENGVLTSEIEDGDILDFSGEFDKDIVIYINKAVKITGNKPIFHNTTFRITCDGVWIENLVIKNRNSSRINAWGILAYRVFGATIKNCEIDVYDRNAAYAIYVVESSSIDVIGNTFSSEGNYLTYTILAHTVEDCRFINNTVFTNGTGEVYTFETGHCIEGDEVCTDGNTVNTTSSTVCTGGDTVCPEGDEVCPEGSSVCPDGASALGSHVLKEVYRTYGILLAYASNNIVSGNRVTVTSKLNQTYSPFNSTNSIVGIDVYYNSHNNVLSNNVVNIKSNDNYIYGMGVLGWQTGHEPPEGHGASNNSFIGNAIVLEGTYFVQGIVIGSWTNGTLIQSNDVDAKSDSVAYGVNLEKSHTSTILDNSFTLNSDSVYGMYVDTSNGNIIGSNEITGNGKQVCGILLLNAKNNSISYNNVTANGTDDSIILNLDQNSAANSGIRLSTNSSFNTIEHNNITSEKGYAIDVSVIAVNNTISDNYLKSERGIGDKAINLTNDNNNTIEHNYVYLVNGDLKDILIKYLENGTFVFETNDANLEGANVTFYIENDIEFGSAIVTNGKASLRYNLAEFEPAPYAFNAKVVKENYKITEFTAYLEVEDGILDVSVANVTGAVARTAKFTAIVKNILGEGVEGIVVAFTVEDEGYREYIGSATTDKNGLAVLTTEIPQVYDEHPRILVEINDPYHYDSTTAYGNLSARWLTDTKIIPNTKVYSDSVLAVLKDKNGDVLANKEISVKIGTKSYNLMTNDAGEILMLKLARGTYQATYSFAGDNDYYLSSASNKVTVMPSISGNKNFNVYYGNTIAYKVRITGSDGKFVGAGKSVTIKVNGQAYNVKTDKNGYATKSLKLKTGTYTITSEFNGDKVSNKIVIKPTLIAKNTVAKKAKKVKFTVKLVDKKGKVLKNKKITFKVKGKKYKAKTNKKGVATVYFKNLKVGKFTVSSSYGGCTIYNTLKIKK